MARARNIKPKIMDNEELAELPFEARLLFIYLWMLADREGRLEDRPRRIAAQALPYDRDVDVINTLTLLQRSGFIARYEVEGSRYIQITGFTKHQVPHHKEVASEIPPPEGTPAITRHAYDVPAEQRVRIFERDGHACLKCGDKSSLTIDHIVPLSKGGDNCDANLQCLCHRCNSAKGDAVKSYVDGNAPSSPRTNSSKGQRRAIVEASCPTDTGFSDTGFSDSLIPEDDSSSSPPAPTDAGRICLVVKSEGIGLVNPNHPDLIELLANGATTIDFIEASRITVKAAKGFSYMLGVVKGRLQDQKNAAKNPDKLESFAERDARIKRARWEVMTNKIHPDNVGKLPYPLETVVDVASKILEVV